MNRIWGRILTSAALVAVVSGIAAACSLPHNDESVFIRNAIQPPEVQVGTNCTYTADPTLPQLPSGVLDVSLLRSYHAELLVGNQLIAQANAAQGRVESNRVTITGVEVNVTDATEQHTIASYSKLGSGFIDPSDGTTPGYGLVSAELVDPTVSAPATSLALGSTNTIRVVAHVKAFGKTLGGQSVESSEFVFPIDMCNGCLVIFPIGSQNDQQAQMTGKPNCAAALGSSSSGGGQVFQPCFMGQDQNVDCRLCQGNPACDPSMRATTTGG